MEPSLLHPSITAGLESVLSPSLEAELVLQKAVVITPGEATEILDMQAAYDEDFDDEESDEESDEDDEDEEVEDDGDDVRLVIRVAME